MKRRIQQTVIALVVLGSGVMGAFAQSPTVEVFGGYSFARQGSVNITKGFDASVAGNFNRYFGLVGDVGGNFYSEDLAVVSGGSILTGNVNVNLLFYRGGPKFTFRSEGMPVEPFFQALVGGARTSAGVGSSGVNVSASVNGFSWAAGGGLDVRVAHHLAIRAAQVEFNQFRFSGDTSNGVRASTGVVFRF